MLSRRLLCAVSFGLCAIPAAGVAQQQAGAPLARDEITALARVQVAIVAARDSINVRLAKSGNKTAKAQAQLQDTLRAQIEQILHHAGITDADYRRRTYIVSSDSATRRVFDSVVVALTNAPLPGGIARGMIVPVPAGPTGTHIAHVVNEFNDTPNRQGLLGTALAEARIAIAHATLAGRQPANLEYMKTHAAHVIHALDPTVINMGPGQGYGVKKATAGVVTHIELAAAAQGASPGVVSHSKHIATAARNTSARTEQLLAIAQKVQAAEAAGDAAALVNQMMSLAEQLVAGADANSDGRITWEAGEGGLLHVDEHLKLMLRP
jgi:hypothetical protein